MAGQPGDPRRRAAENSPGQHGQALSISRGLAQNHDHETTERQDGGISDSSGNSTLLFRELLSKNGVAVDTVQLRALGEPSVRLGALLGGAVDATMITIGMARQAQAKGFRILAYSGDYVSALSANLETTDDKIQNSADEVYKVVKATLKGQLFYHRNPNEAAKFIMEVLRITDFNEAKDIWRERDKQASEIAKIGQATEEVMMTNNKCIDI
jgi:ABC-type nitrate/sulfonate/bicarbonate transport system substrate-binding protein